MKIKVDWSALGKAVLNAVVKTALPFLAGALGGLVGGCSVFGPVVGKTAVF